MDGFSWPAAARIKKKIKRFQECNGNVVVVVVDVALEVVVVAKGKCISDEVKDLDGGTT